IIKDRKKSLHDTLKKNLEELKSSILEPKKYTEFTTNLEFFVQNILKFEFLGLSFITLKKSNYPLFCYYFGEDNTFENLSKKTNWKILPSSLVDLFHGTYKKTWKEFLHHNEDYYNINNMEPNHTFKLISTMKSDQMKLLYKDQFLIPKLIDDKIDKDNLLI